MKQKHNKKRNTAFLYEALIKEITKAVVEKNIELKNKIVFIVKESFKKNSFLYQELKLYKSLCDTYNLEPHLAERLIYEIRQEHSKIDRKELFMEQSALIKKVNSLLSKSIFSNFVPNYKSLATIYQIFNEETPIKKRILLENALVKKISSQLGDNELKVKPVDGLVYKSFVQRFNSEYSSKLISEQKELLNKYISSFLDNGIDLKIFLNEELSRLKKVVKRSLKLDDMKQDSEMASKAKKVLEVLDNFKEEKINKNLIMKVMKIQNLAKEIENDGH